MKNKNVKGIVALAIVTALSFGVIIGSNKLSKNIAGDAGNETSKVMEELDPNGAEGIDKAVKTEDGYIVTVRQKGYGGDIVMNVSFDDTASTVTKLEITEHNETETLGAKIVEEDFLKQFDNVKAPVYLPGMSLESDGNAPEKEDILKDATLTDGTFSAKGEPDSNGFTDEVTLTVTDGKITAVNWDAVMEDGTKKSVMSENGQYTMTEDGLTWKAQSEALAAALIENQSLSFFTVNAEGKTDVVSGVSISINGFISLAEKCLMESAGIEAETASSESPSQDGTQIDAISGATVSSTAVVTGINNAYEFLQSAK